MIDINTAVVITQCDGGFVSHILTLIHFLPQKVEYLDGHAFLEIVLKIKGDVGLGRVWIQFYLFASFCRGYITCSLPL